MAGWITDAEIAYNLTQRVSAVDPTTAVDRSLGMADAMLAEATLETGWGALVASTDPSSRDFDPPAPISPTTVGLTGGGSFLDFGKWAAQTVSKVEIVSASGQSVELDGSLYRVWPYSDDHVEGLQLLTHLWAERGGIRVTGVFGRFGADAVPVNLIRVGLRVAVCRVAAEAIEWDGGGRISWKEGDASESYDQTQFERKMEAVNSTWLRALAAYRRISF